MDPSSFIEAYKMALRSQDWAQVRPLIHQEAVVIFSNGARLDGIEQIAAAYQRNFETIKNEDYRVENVHWVLKTDKSAAYVFDFFWTGRIDGQLVSGSGRGTAVLAKVDSTWLLVSEQLGPRA